MNINKLRTRRWGRSENNRDKRAGLTSLTIPDSVRNIGGHVFNGCTGLTSLTIPNSVTNIGEYAFQKCKNLSTILIPEGVMGIDACAFDECTGLSSLTIPNSVTNIGSYVFRGCTNLISASLGKGVGEISMGAFQKCTKLTSLVIPDSVTNIDLYAFSGCSGLASVSIGNSVETIDTYAFEGCTGLTSLTLPNCVTQIWTGAFSGCSSLETLYVPASWKNSHVLPNSAVPSGCTVVYVPDQQTVTFDSNGGNCETSKFIYAVGKTYSSFPSATRERYAFAGWWTEATGGQRVLESDMVQAVETRTLYAHWTLAEQVVTFNANGGTCGTSQRVFAVGQAYGTLPKPTMPQHVFAGWWTTATGGEQVTATSTVPGSTTRMFYAHWTKVAAAQVTECILTAETETCTVHFPGQAGVTYALQCRRNLGGNEGWTTLTTKSREKDGKTTLSAGMPEGWNCAFYRVVAEESP